MPPSGSFLPVAASWRPWRRPGLQAQVREHALDYWRFEDGCDDLDLTTEFAATLE